MPHQASGMLTRMCRHQLSRISARTMSPITGSSFLCSATQFGAHGAADVGRSCRPCTIRSGRSPRVPTVLAIRQRPDHRQAIGKGQREFLRRHAVEGEALDQRRRAILLGHGELADRDGIAHRPRRDRHGETDGEGGKALPHGAAGRSAAGPSRVENDQHQHHRRQHDERRAGEAQQAEQHAGRARHSASRGDVQLFTSASMVRLNSEKVRLSVITKENSSLGRQQRRWWRSTPVSQNVAAARENQFGRARDRQHAERQQQRMNEMHRPRIGLAAVAVAPLVIGFDAAPGRLRRSADRFWWRRARSSG